MNSWKHFHPVTGMINDSDNNKVFGTDFEVNYKHKLFNNDAVLVGGVTWKIDRTKDAKKYQYADLTSTSTGSKNRGTLANTEDSKTVLYGVYIMESFSPNNKY